jgi:hypothetical protein
MNKIINFLLSLAVGDYLPFTVSYRLLEEVAGTEMLIISSAISDKNINWGAVLQKQAVQKPMNSLYFQEFKESEKRKDFSIWHHS